jgi:hypothetical protein
MQGTVDFNVNNLFVLGYYKVKMKLFAVDTGHAWMLTLVFANQDTLEATAR